MPRAGHAVDHVRVGLDVQAGPVAEPARGFGDREPGVVARARVRVTQRVEADVAGASKRGITSGGAAVVVEMPSLTSCSQSASRVSRSSAHDGVSNARCSSTNRCASRPSRTSGLEKLRSVTKGSGPPTIRSSFGTPGSAGGPPSSCNAASRNAPQTDPRYTRPSPQIRSAHGPVALASRLRPRRRRRTRQADPRRSRWPCRSCTRNRPPRHLATPAHRPRAPHPML